MLSGARFDEGRDSVGGGVAFPRRADVRGLRLPASLTVAGASAQTRARCALRHAPPCFPRNGQAGGALDSPAGEGDDAWRCAINAVLAELVAATGPGRTGESGRADAGERKGKAPILAERGLVFVVVLVIG
ncbi:hypothetical protein CDA09_05380 [Azoarcus sp. DN11]|nr:hypothetical protein CDA09_05380 [Azoarcus sp. DN11]